MVAQGWCKATDASGYIISYYEHLDEMTPITIADYRDPKDHGRLIRDEPMLTTAILLISARFNNAPAAGTHAVLLNEKLAEQLQAQIKQVYWAGDIFGNDTSSGSMRLSLSPSSSERTLRSLGTIESLLLLMEWHHKSFHFPARDVLSRPLGMGSNANGYTKHLSSVKQMLTSSTAHSPTGDNQFGNPTKCVGAFYLQPSQSL